MVQNSSNPFISSELFAKVLGQSLTEQELLVLHQHIKIIEPTALKKFWSSEKAESGIHIIISGKARLIDSHDDSRPIALSMGESFGELTLFPKKSWQPYSVKAVKDAPIICYLPEKCLLQLFDQYPDIRYFVYQQAVKRNLLLNESNQLDDGDTDCGKDAEHKRWEDAATQQPKIPNIVSEVSESRRKQKKISKAYFPSPTLQVGHLWQRLTQRYPYFAQQSASDCGAASMVMVARYWGKRFSLNRLRDLANVDRNGASLRGLVAAAESIGFSTRPVKASLDKLAEQSLVAIAHWEGNHYVVVYEVTHKHVILADPAIGQRSLSHAEFKAGWTGNTLLLEPTALVKETKNDSTPFWQLFELVKPH